MTPLKPITRIETYLASLSGDYTGELPAPLTRMERYLASLCGMESEDLPMPITREERYPAVLLGMDAKPPAPLTRVEHIWEAIVGGDPETPMNERCGVTPATREERFLCRFGETVADESSRRQVGDGKNYFTANALDPFGEDQRLWGYSRYMFVFYGLPRLHRCRCIISSTDLGLRSPANAYAAPQTIREGIVSGDLRPARQALAKVGGNAMLGLDTDGGFISMAADPTLPVDFQGDGRGVVADFWYTTV